MKDTIQEMSESELANVSGGVSEASAYGALAGIAVATGVAVGAAVLLPILGGGAVAAAAFGGVAAAWGWATSYSVTTVLEK